MLDTLALITPTTTTIVSVVNAPARLCQAILFRGYTNELLTKSNTEHQVLLYKTLIMYW